MENEDFLKIGWFNYFVQFKVTSHLYASRSLFMNIGKTHQISLVVIDKLILEYFELNRLTILATLKL